MTEPRQDYPTDPQLSRLYRDHAQREPSAAVDQRILAAARQAVAPRAQSVRRNGWWQRVRMPLTLVATVMLTVSLVLQIERQPEELSAIPDIKAPDRAHEKDRAPESNKPAEMRAESSAPAARAKVAPVPESAGQLPASREDQNLPRSSGLALERAQAAPPPFDKPAKSESQPVAAGVSSEAVEAKGMGELRAAPESSAARPAAAPLKKSLTDNARAPEAWLDEIRSLRRAGKLEEAERQLREFRLAYPAYPLPEEFRQK